MKTFYSETGGLNELGRSVVSDMDQGLSKLVDTIISKYPEIETRELEYLMVNSLTTEFACKRLAQASKLYKEKKANEISNPI